MNKTENNKTENNKTENNKTENNKTENNKTENNKTENNKTEFYKKINTMPEVIILLIQEYIPKHILVFTNRENYQLYHSLIINSIKDYNTFIKDTIKRDNEFVFDTIVRENYLKWFTIKQYRYKNMIFLNYLYFMIHFCIENDSNNCRKVINNFLKEHGLDKNLHKKNVVKYIKWKD